MEGCLSLFFPDHCQICQAQPANRELGYVCHVCRGSINGLEPLGKPFCDRCGLPFPISHDVVFECADCVAEPPAFRHARAGVKFKGVAREAALRYKYHHELFFELFLAELLGLAATWLNTGDYDAIIPIPLHRSKRRLRGFNQAARLARRLSSATTIPARENWLWRIRETETQTRLTRGERASNVKGAFACNDKAQLKGARVLLVDDVLTTGATAGACAATLLSGGAASVDVCAVARGVMD